MKAITIWCLTVGSLLLCMSAKVAVTSRDGEGVTGPGGHDALSQDYRSGPPGIRQNLGRGQRAAIQVQGTTFFEGRLNGLYRECGRLNSAPLYRLGSTDAYLGWSTVGKRWVIGFQKSGVSSSMGIYYSIAKEPHAVPPMGWRPSPVWPGSAPAPTVSIIAEDIPKVPAGKVTAKSGIS